MSDLIERLRGAYSTIFERSLAREAADEIDRLNGVISDGAKWVSVEERVPGEEVLTCTDEREVGMGWFDPLYGWRESGSGMRFADMGRNIDYWMPLPEAPK